MAKKNLALITPEVLLWARQFAQIPLEEAAKSAGVKVEKLIAWEAGEEYPTIRQAKILANKYRVPFACFYLPFPPEIKLPKNKDFRKLYQPLEQTGTFSTELIFLMRDALEKREIALDLLEELGSKPKPFEHFIEISSLKKSTISDEIRGFLGISYETQKKLRNPRKAFNFFRMAFERSGILVFQAKDIPLFEMRGMSIYEELLPIIIVNRKDTYTARCFTLFHELVHILTRTPGICDIIEDEEPNIASDIESLCNKVAAECLVPKNFFVKENIVREKQGSHWTDEEIKKLSNLYSVSREVIVRRLYDLNYVDINFYKAKRIQYIEEFKNYEGKKDKKSGSGGFIHPVTDVVSSAGKLFVGLVLEAFNQNYITPNEASSFLGIRTKYFSKLESAMMRV